MSWNKKQMKFFWIPVKLTDMVKLTIITKMKLAHLRGTRHQPMSDRQWKCKEPISNENGAAIVHFKTIVF